MNAAAIPDLDLEFFSEENLRDSGPMFREIREAGPVVRLPALDLYALGRYSDVKAALRDDESLISGKGVSINAMLNDIEGTSAPYSSLTSDGDKHKQLKSLVMKPLAPAALQDIKDRVQEEAASVVGRLSNGEPFDVMTDLATHLPYRIVASMVGIKGVDAERMLAWSAAAFDGFGPMHLPRTQASLEGVQDFVAFAGQLDRSGVEPGSWADQLLEQGEKGEIPVAQARDMVFDYVIPSLDTTIQSTGELFYQLALNPDAFAALKANPDLVPSAVTEAVRMAAPLRGFTRYAVKDYQVGEHVIPEGSRVWLLWASANRDERHYPNPDVFDVARNPRDQLAWGHGAHMCAGMHLSRLEMESLLRAVLSRVEGLELKGVPERAIYNATQGYLSMPYRFL